MISNSTVYTKGIPKQNIEHIDIITFKQLQALTIIMIYTQLLNPHSLESVNINAKGNNSQLAMIQYRMEVWPQKSQWLTNDQNTTDSVEDTWKQPGNASTTVMTQLKEHSIKITHSYQLAFHTNKIYLTME